MQAIFRKLGFALEDVEGRTDLVRAELEL